MKGLLRALLALVLAAGAQAVTSVHAPGVAALDLFLLITVYYALSRNQFVGMVAGTAAGLAHDAVSSNLVGTYAFANTLTGYLVGGFGARFELHQPAPQALALSLATALQEGLVRALHLVVGHPTSFPSARQLLLRMLLNAAVGVAAFALLRRRRERRR